MDLKEQIESLKKQLGEKDPQSAQHVNKLEPKSPLTRTKTPKSPVGPNSGMNSRPLPKTPESQVSIRNEIIISSEIRGSTANVKSSHIRKSLRTIGKLINGSEKRIQTKTNEVQSSTVTPPTIARQTRRQSLTGVQPLDRSRRTSLGGVDPCVDGGNRNAKTPQPVSRTDKTKWM